MATFSYTNGFTAGSPAVATQVNANFNDVKAFAVGIASGTNLDTNAVTGTKIAANAVSYAKLDTSITNLLTPIAGVVQYMGATEPTNWKFCNGQVLTIANYPDVYAALTNGGTVFRYGANPTGSTFVLPDMRHRVPVGLGSEAEFDTLGEVGGAKTHTLTEAQIPSHTHIQNQHSHGVTDPKHNHTQNPFGSNPVDNGGVNGFVLTGASIDSGGATRGLTAEYTYISINQETATNQYTGGSQAHNNLQPYMTVNYLIRVL
jgi:microcystin-dependent protein